MLKNITLGQYYPGDSVIHRLDPRIKIILALALIVIVFLIDTIWGFAALAVFIGIVVALAQVGAGSVIRSIRPLLFIIIFTFILNLFFYGGATVLFQWGSLKVTEEGILRAVLIVLRLMFLIFSTSLLTLTTSPMQLTDGMESLMKPLNKIKFPVHEMSMMMSIALRFIPTLAEETDRIMKAQMARGAEFDTGNILKKARNMVPLLVPLFVSAFKRADELALAMESRCYPGGEGRTKMKILRFAGRDWASVAITGAVSALLVVFF
ncbi:MAG: energy-coupling factor transporter transmembrane component T [Eubacteriales bacterium]